MPIYALALSARSGPTGYVSQVATTFALSEAGAEGHGLTVIRNNFPLEEGYTFHACAVKEISPDWILAEAARLIGFDPTQLERN